MNTYLPTIAKLKDTAKGRVKVEQLAHEMRQDWAERGLSELTQQQGLMDRTRRAIKDQLGEEHFSLELIKFTREEQFALNSQKRQQVGERNLQQQYLDNPEGIVAQAVRLLESPEWAEVAAGLTLLTGRRSTEILQTAEFEVKTQWSVLFKGALKRRGEQLVFEIPTLTTAQRVVDAVGRLRSLVDVTGMSGQEVNAKYGAAVSQASDRAFGELVPVPPGKDNLYTHLWRSVYVCIATFWYCPKHVWDVLFKAHALGHFEALESQEQAEGGPLQQRLTTISSERFYALYEIADSVVAQHGGKRKGIKLGHGGVMPIEVFKAGMPQEQPVREKRKQLSSVRMWREDRSLLQEVLAQLAGEEHRLPDRVGDLLRWVRDRLDREKEEKVKAEAADKEPVEVMRTAETQLAEAKDKGQQQGEQRAESPTSIAGAGTQEERPPITVEAQLVQEPEPQSAAAEARTERQEQPVTSGLEQKLDKLLDVMTQFVTLQMQTGTGQTGQERQADTQRGGKQEADSKSRQSQLSKAKGSADKHQGGKTAIENSRQSKASKTKATGTAKRMPSSETEARIRKAITAIMEYNSQPDLPQNLKWAITINSLKGFVTSQRKIEQILSEKKTAIEAHHQVQQIDPLTQNINHRRKRVITDVIHV